MPDAGMLIRQYELLALYRRSPSILSHSSRNNMGRAFVGTDASLSREDLRSPTGYSLSRHFTVFCILSIRPAGPIHSHSRGVARSFESKTRTAGHFDITRKATPRSDHSRVEYL